MVANRRIFKKGVRLTEEDDVMELVDHCVEVFIACDFQLPNYLAHRLTECRCPLDEFFDYAVEMMITDEEQLFETYFGKRIN